MPWGIIIQIVGSPWLEGSLEHVFWQQQVYFFFLISDFCMKKRSIMRWWDEKKRRWGKHLGGKAAMGIQCWKDRQSQSQDRLPQVCGWANITNSSSSFCSGRSVHNKSIIVLKTKQSNPAFACDHGPDLHHSWVSKLYGLLALWRLYLKNTKKKITIGNGKNLAISGFVGKVTPLCFPSFLLLL